MRHGGRPLPMAPATHPRATGSAASARPAPAPVFAGQCTPGPGPPRPAFSYATAAGAQYLSNAAVRSRAMTSASRFSIWWRSIM